MKEEILNILNIVLEQKYIQISKQYYQQTEGLTMRATTSDILAEVYHVQHLEHASVVDILKTHQILDYHRYVDDILIVYDEQKQMLPTFLKILIHTPRI
jgi:hypothetical protein